MQQALKQIKERFLSLDVFRGITICFMIIVNTPGSGAESFWPLQHAVWHGFTPTDLVFPSFLFAVGNALSFSMKNYRLMDSRIVLGKILKRAAIIFLIGYLLFWFPFFEGDANGNFIFSSIANTRIMGVLQRIALCYGFAALMIYYLPGRLVLLLSALLLAAYWVILLIFGAPVDPLSLTGNAGILVDKFLLGETHMYGGDGIAFDPEGMLSTLPAIVNVVAGYYAGVFIQKSKSNKTVIALLLAGFLLVAGALVWHNVFPVNKKLWSSSFVLLTAGLDLLLIAALLYMIEIKQYTRYWTNFFTMFGKNPLLIYIVSELLVIILYRIPAGVHSTLYEWVNDRFYQGLFPGAVGSLLFALTAMLLCWLLAYVLNRKKIYIKI